MTRTDWLLAAFCALCGFALIGLAALLAREERGTR